MILKMFMRSAYVSCYTCTINIMFRDGGGKFLTIFCNRRTSSSWAATLRRLRPRRDSVLSSPLRTLSMTSLSKATLRAYALTAASGSSLVRSS
jgi:hypothetical protein